MRMAFAAAVLLSTTSAAFAQEDPMEAQRCIWRCLAESNGADDPAYHMCVQQMCNGEASEEESVAPAPRSTRQTQASPARAAPGTWAYGSHPLLGLSAHVQTPEGTIGLACANTGSDYIGTANIVALRISDELFRGDHLTYVFEDNLDAATMSNSGGSGFAEKVAKFSTSRPLWNFPAFNLA